MAMPLFPEASLPYQLGQQPLAGVGLQEGKPGMYLGFIS